MLIAKNNRKRKLEEKRYLGKKTDINMYKTVNE